MAVRRFTALALATLMITVGLSPALAQDGGVPAAGAPTVAAPVELPLMSFGDSPVSFEENRGQSDPAVRFLSRVDGIALFFTQTEIVMVLAQSAAASGRASEPDVDSTGIADEADAPAASQRVIRMRLVGGNSAPLITGHDELASTTNYFLGNDATKWITDVPSFARIVYDDVYPGIDLVFYGSADGRLEYDLIVAPGADPRSIQWAIDGATPVLTQTGFLSLATEVGTVSFEPPVLYQVIAGVKTPVDGGFAIDALGPVRYDVGRYDVRETLVIDPVLTWSHYLGGTQFDHIHDVAVDQYGNTFYAGVTLSTDFPLKNALDTTHTGVDSDIFVAKYSHAGIRQWSTYLGGTNRDSGSGIALMNGDVYITGNTRSQGTFPSLQRPFGGGFDDAIVARLTGNGNTLVYAVQLGGSGSALISDQGYKVAVDPSDNAYVVGVTSSTGTNWNNPVNVVLPMPASNQQNNGGAEDAFVAKFSPTGTLDAFTYLGGGGSDTGRSIALDPSGNVFVIGSTQSSNFPRTLGSLAGHGQQDAFVTKLSSTLSITWSRYLGGDANDWGSGIAVDQNGDAYVTGHTASANFPTTSGTQTAWGGNLDAFVTRLQGLTGTNMFSTYLGGTNDDVGTDIVERLGRVFVTGHTDSTNFPTTAGTDQANLAGVRDGFVTILSSSLTSPPIWSTHLGGKGDEFEAAIAIDRNCNLYVAGTTNSGDFPTVPAGLTSNTGLEDAFLTKLTNPGDWCGCPGDKPVKEFYREDGNHTKTRAMAGLDNWGVTFLDPPTLPCPGSKFWLTLDWASAEPSRVYFNGNVIATYPGGSPPAAPIHTVIDVTNMMAPPPNDNKLTADVVANTAFNTTYSLVGSSCDCNPDCPDGTPIADHPIVWRMDLSTGVKTESALDPMNQAEPTREQDTHWDLVGAPFGVPTVLPSVYVAVNIPPATAVMWPGQWITPGWKDPMFSSPPFFFPGDHGLLQTSSTKPYRYENNFDVLMTQPVAAPGWPDIRYLLLGGMAGDESSLMTLNGYPIPGSTIGSSSNPSIIRSDVTDELLFEQNNQLDIESYNKGPDRTTGMAFRGILTAHLCSCDAAGNTTGGSGDDTVFVDADVIKPKDLDAGAKLTKPVVRPADESQTRIDGSGVWALVEGALSSAAIQERLPNDLRMDVKIARKGSTELTYTAMIVDRKVTSIAAPAENGSAKYTLSMSEPASLSIINAFEPGRTASLLFTDGFVAVNGESQADKVALKGASSNAGKALLKAEPYAVGSMVSYDKVAETATEATEITAPLESAGGGLFKVTFGTKTFLVDSHGGRLGSVTKDPFVLSAGNSLAATSGVTTNTKEARVELVAKDPNLKKMAETLSSLRSSSAPGNIGIGTAPAAKGNIGIGTSPMAKANVDAFLNAAKGVKGTGTGPGSPVFPCVAGGIPTPDNSNFAIALNPSGFLLGAAATETVMAKQCGPGKAPAPPGGTGGLARRLLDICLNCTETRVSPSNDNVTDRRVSPRRISIDNGSTVATRNASDKGGS